MNIFAQLSILSLWAGLYLRNIVLLLLVLYLFYIFFFHYRGKKKFPPGPFALPLVGNLPFLGSKPYETVAKMRKKYGDIIGLKFGRNYVIALNEFKILKEGMSHPSSFNRPGDIMGDLNFGFAFASGQAWTEQRRFVSQAMRSLGLGKEPWESLVKDSAISFIKKLKSYKGEPVDIAAEIEGCICNDFMPFVSGRKLDPETEKDKIKEIATFSDLISKYSGAASLGSYIPGFKMFCEYFHIGEYRQVAECIKNFQALTKKEIEKHLRYKDFQNSPDFLNMYKVKMEAMKTHEGNHYFTDEYMLGNANVLLLGGTTTVTNAILSLFRLMAANLDVQKKVHKELDSAIGREGSIWYDQKSKVPYTFAAMLEAQRCFTLCPFTTRMISVDIELGGYLIPKGSHIVGNLWAVHNDPDNWKDPHLFKPERFLKDDKTEVVKNPPNFAPFSVGKRNCVVDTIAYVMIFAYFTSVMQRFKINAPPGMQLTFDSTFGLSTHIERQPLCFTERDNIIG